MGLPLDVGCDRYEVKPKRATITGHADGPVHIMQTGGQLEIDAFVRSIIQVEGKFKKKNQSLTICLLCEQLALFFLICLIPCLLPIVSLQPELW
jgi:hypothetical protein